MWSGPRTVSTALMRSFGNRPDTVVALACPEGITRAAVLELAAEAGLPCDVRTSP